MMSEQMVNEDKKNIEREERESMLNEVNKVQDSVEVTEVKEISKLNKDDIKEGREVKPKKIPIGGIQMPGFFTRSKSKEKCKDGESEQGNDEVEDIELLEPGASKEQDERADEKMTRIKLPNPFNKKPKGDGTPEGDKPSEGGGQRKSIIDTIRIPLVSVFPKKSRSPDPQGMGAQSGAAGLASMETLDDDRDRAEGELKNVKLDVDAPAEKQEQTEQAGCRARLRSYHVVISALLLFVLALIVILWLMVPGPQPVTPPVRDGKFVVAVTQCGLVEGILGPDAVSFMGIPYAAPPLGELRWQPAQPLGSLELCWNGTLPAYNDSEPCPQLGPGGADAGAEDCLTLDVVTPAVRYDNPLPVVVLVGADTLMGGEPSPLRPSARFARLQDVVFVRPNFRLGALGFLALDLLSRDSRPPTSGNYGLSDLLQALRWVQTNIQHFGGDPGAVTLLGHRAGATLVTALAGSPAARGLFARVWAASGSVVFPSRELVRAEQAHRPFLDEVRCGDLGCLRAADPAAMVDGALDTWRKPGLDLPLPGENPAGRHEWLVLDGHILRENPASGWQRGELPVQLVLGSTAHAAASDFVLQRHRKWTPELVRAHVRSSELGRLNLTDEALARYPATCQGLVALISDIRVVCPLYASAARRAGAAFYVVTQLRGPFGLADVDSDVDAMLGRYGARNATQRGAAPRNYAAAMQQLFYQFVWHGRLPARVPGQPVLLVDQDVLPVANYSHCDFWIDKGIVPKFAQLD